MSKNPDERFATAREMVDALRSVAGGKRSTAGAAPTRLWLPAVAGAGVLGLSVAAVLAMRGGDDERTRSTSPVAAPVAAPAGMVRLEILSVPPGAEVRRGGNLVGLTAMQFDVPKGETIALELRKAGYTTLRDQIHVTDEAPRLPVYRLAEINGFEGVWTLPGGQLRSFKRNADKVAVSKLDTVDGPQTFFRHFELVAADTGVTFATSEEMVDPRAPNEPSCHIPHRVEYHYEPATDAFEVRRERVAVDLVDGSCVIRSATLEPPLKLARADVRSETERVSLPPVGKPVFDDNELGSKFGKSLKGPGKPPAQKAQPQKLSVPTKADVTPPVQDTPPAQSPPVQTSNIDANGLGNAAAAPQNEQQQAVQPQVANPPANVKPQSNLAPRVKGGDSQIAPPVQQKKN